MINSNEQWMQNPPEAFNGLTLREHEILDLVIQGMTNKMIAKQLFISEETTKRHVKHILQKFDVHNRYELLCCLLRSRNMREIPDSVQPQA